MADEKSTTNIWVLILVLLIVYMVWAYYQCQHKSKLLGTIGGHHKGCHPFVGLEPLEKLFKPHHNKHQTYVTTTDTTIEVPVIPISTGTGTSTDTSISVSTSTDTTIPTSTSTSTSTSTDTTVTPSITSTNILVTNVNGALLYDIRNSKNGVVVKKLNMQLQKNAQVPYTQSVVVSSITFYLTQYGWVSSTDIQTV